MRLLRRPSDDQLLARAAGGDGEAFAVFYRRYLPGVLAFMARRTADAETSADLTAEVFAAALLAAGRYEPRDGSAAGWIFGIARNKLLESLRRGRVENGARLRLRLEPVELDDAALERIDALLSPAGAHAALRRLPPEQREAVSARVVGEQDYAAIAARMRCSESVVRQRVSRGLAAMREELRGGA